MRPVEPGDNWLGVGVGEVVGVMVRVLVLSSSTSKRTAVGSGVRNVSIPFWVLASLFL